jgi:hypothetical protein
MKGDVKHICRYCRRVFMASRESAAENPWCRHCLNERLAIAGIVSWLRDGAGEIRAKGSVAWEDAIMPIYRELADRIEKRKWLSAASQIPRKEGET